MTKRGKFNLLGVMIDATDYESVVDRVMAAARAPHSLAVTALAVHGVMTGHANPAHRTRLNGLDLVVPDGQPVRWALNALHGTSLAERVYGPELMLRVLAEAERQATGIYLYGSTADVLGDLVAALSRQFPRLQVCGAEPSQFRRLDVAEKANLIARIRGSGARIAFVGLGCPRQEVWAYEYRQALGMPILAVGAAFDFHAGTLPQAPMWMQRRGLEWLFRLGREPNRLWRRYLLLNPWYVALVTLQGLRLRRFSVAPQPVAEESHG